MDSTIRIVLLGDSLILKSMKNLVEHDERFGRVQSILREADLVFAECENPLTTKGVPAEKIITVRGDPSIVNDLKMLGYDAVTLANNHAMDYGWEGLSETMDTLRENGIKYVGAGKNLDEAWSPLVIQQKGIRIGFVAFSNTLAMGFAAGPRRPGVAPIHVTTLYENQLLWMLEEPGSPPVIKTEASDEDRELLKKSLKRAKEQCDFLIAVPHWGRGSQEEVLEYQKLLGHDMVENGVDLIYGMHAHVVHPVEIYKRVPIIYCMNNFIFHAPSEWVDLIGREAFEYFLEPESFIVRATLTERKLSRVEFIPIKHDRGGNPYLASKELGDSMINRLAKISSDFSAKIEKREGIAELVLT